MAALPVSWRELLQDLQSPCLSESVLWTRSSVAYASRKNKHASRKSKYASKKKQKGIKKKQCITQPRQAGREAGRKEGRKEERKEGRKEERKEGRKEGKEGRKEGRKEEREQESRQEAEKEGREAGRKANQPKKRRQEGRKRGNRQTPGIEPVSRMKAGRKAARKRAESRFERRTRAENGRARGWKANNRHQPGEKNDYLAHGMFQHILLQCTKGQLTSYLGTETIYYGCIHGAWPCVTATREMARSNLGHLVHRALVAMSLSRRGLVIILISVATLQRQLRFGQETNRRQLV